MPTKDPIKLKAKKVRWYQKNKERILIANSTEKAYKIRSAHLKRKFGMTAEEWDKEFDKQGRVCACCGSDQSGSRHRYGWHTDHDHATGKFRAILCRPCNVALGLVDDRTERLRALIVYLERFNAS